MELRLCSSFLFFYYLFLYFHPNTAFCSFFLSFSLQTSKPFGMGNLQGPLREVVETVQKEVVEGDLLRDCLELGSNDLKGLVQILKDIALQYSSSSGRSEDL